MISRSAAFLLVSLLPPAACSRPLAVSRPVDPAAMVRNQGYALLYFVVTELAQVDLLLIIRNPSPNVDELIRAIASFARRSADELNALARKDPAIGLDQHGLPELEVKTRNAMSDAMAKELVFSGGKDFEFKVLLTQHSALDYVTHMAHELHEQDTDDTRRLALELIAIEGEALHKQVLILLEGPYVGPPDAPAEAP